MGIENHFNSNNTITNQGNSNFNKQGSNTQKIQEFARFLHDDFLEVLSKEYDELDVRQQTAPNGIFPIKMEALAAIYKAAGPLYKWYVENPPKTLA